MPVYHYTFHAYRSWNTDHPRGWVQRGEPGIRRTNVPLAYVRDRLATDLPVAFSEEEQQFLVRACVTAAAHLNCDVYGAVAVSTHLHVIVGWKDEKVSADFIQQRLKRGLGYLLARHRGTNGVPYFSRGGVHKRVWGWRHLRYLVDVYFPFHHGVSWKKMGI